MTADWQPIESAPKDGTKVRLGWIVNGTTLEHEAVSRWRHGQWEGGWTPTHWMDLPDPPAEGT